MRDKAIIESLKENLNKAQKESALRAAQRTSIQEQFETMLAQIEDLKEKKMTLSLQLEEARVKHIEQVQTLQKRFHDTIVLNQKESEAAFMSKLEHISVQEASRANDASLLTQINQLTLDHQESLESAVMWKTQAQESARSIQAAQTDHNAEIEKYKGEAILLRQENEVLKRYLREACELEKATTAPAPRDERLSNESREATDNVKQFDQLREENVRLAAELHDLKQGFESTTRADHLSSRKDVANDEMVAKVTREMSDLEEQLQAANVNILSKEQDLDRLSNANWELEGLVETLREELKHTSAAGHGMHSQIDEMR